MTSRAATWRACTFWTSTMGLAPVTVTVSSTVPTRSWTSRFAVNPDVSSIPSRTSLLNPVRL